MSQLTLQIHAPQPNALLKPGDVITVTGVAAGFTDGNAEPVVIDSVIVALAGVQVAATLTRVPAPAVLTKRFEASLTVPAVVGNQQVVVAAAGDNQETVEVDVPVVLPMPVVSIPVVPMPWTNSQLAAQGSLSVGARLTAIAKPVGCELWWIGMDGAVNGVWSEPGSAWSPYQLAGPGSAAAAGGISAISKGGDVMEMWWIGPDGSVQAAYHEGEWKRYALAGPGSASLTGGIAGIWKGGDVMEVWWIALDGSIQAAYHEGEWRTYTLAGAGSASLNGSITAISKGGDVMEMWWIGPDGSVQAAYHEGEWKRYVLAGPAAAALNGGITSVFKGSDVMEVWWVAPDGSVTGASHAGDWHTYLLASAGSASTTCRISSTYTTTFAGNVMRVWWVDASGGTYQAYFDSSVWTLYSIGAGADPAGSTVGVLFNPETPTAFWARQDGSLADAYPPEITLSARVSGGRGLRGMVWLTLRQDGSTQWRGDVTNNEPYGYHFGLSVFARTGTSLDIGAAHDGHVAGWGEPGGSDDIWSEEHPAHLALAGGLAAYRFSGLALRLEHSIDVVDYVKSVLDGIFEISAGITVGLSTGLVLVPTSEIISKLGIGSFIPGAFSAGGVPWLAGPAGIFVRVLATAAHDDGRVLTEQEYAWANDMVFKGSLPSRESFRITNYIGFGNRPFTWPTAGGPTLVNLGNALYTNIHSDEKTIIHELTHVCQLAHTQNALFTAKAIATQLWDQVSGGVFGSVYDYGPAGFDFTDLGFEAQAQVVEDWFLGHPAKPLSPDPRNYTTIRMDALSPYYRYITDNVRIGLF